MRFCTCLTLVVAAILSSGAVHNAAAQSSTAAPRPASFTLADFQGLRFLEGNWKGSGYAPGPFYETYRFVNDSTIEMTGWADSTLTRRGGDVSTYVIRAGEIRKGDGKAALMRIDSLGYHFRSRSGPHGWVFRRISADRWTATLGANGATVYTMDRIKR